MRAVIEVTARKGRHGEEEIRHGISLARKRGVHVFDAMHVADKYPIGDALAAEDEASIGYKAQPLYQPRRLAAYLEQALMELRRDEIDIFWLAGSFHLKRNLLDVIALHREGKIRRIGVADMRLKQCKQAQRILQNEGMELYGVRCAYSLLAQRNRETLAWCVQENMVFWATDPLARGFLVSEDWWLENLFPGSVEKLKPLHDLLRAIGGKYRMSLEACALAYAKAKGAVPLEELPRFLAMKEFEDRGEICETDVLALEKKAGQINIAWAHALARSLGR